MYNTESIWIYRKLLIHALKISQNSIQRFKLLSWNMDWFICLHFCFHSNNPSISVYIIYIWLLKPFRPEQWFNFTHHLCALILSDAIRQNFLATFHGNFIYFQRGIRRRNLSSLQRWRMVMLINKIVVFGVLRVLK